MQVKPALGTQCAALTSALRQHLPQCAFLEPQGGYFVWLQLPDKVCCVLMWRWAERLASWTPGVRAEQQGKVHIHFLRSSARGCQSVWCIMCMSTQA